MSRRCRAEKEAALGKRMSSLGVRREELGVWANAKSGIRNEELEVGWGHKIRFVAVRGLYMIFGDGWMDT